MKILRDDDRIMTGRTRRSIARGLTNTEIAAWAWETGLIQSATD